MFWNLFLFSVHQSFFKNPVTEFLFSWVGWLSKNIGEYSKYSAHRWVDLSLCWDFHSWAGIVWGIKHFYRGSKESWLLLSITSLFSSALGFSVSVKDLIRCSARNSDCLPFPSAGCWSLHLICQLSVQDTFPKLSSYHLSSLSPITSHLLGSFIFLLPPSLFCIHQSKSFFKSSLYTFEKYLLNI